MFACTGYAAQSGDQKLAPFDFQRRDPGPTDVRIGIKFCGVCHSDLHTVRAQWDGTQFPCVPGHEIVGHVTAVGAEVSKFAVGDAVGVGCMVDSCRSCAACREGLEQFCENGFTGTYNGADRHTGGHTFGGYARDVVVDQDFVLRLPDTSNLAAIAPLLCAGITTFSPMRHWNVQAGQTVGVIGLGGLGHMAVKIAHAMGAHVVLFTTSPGKTDDAKRLGADEVVVSRDADAMAAVGERFDFIIDTVAAPHDVSAYLQMLKRDCAMVQVGAPEKPLTVSPFALFMKRRSFAGSLIGGIAETQEMLDFCAAHGITADIELIAIDGIDAAYDRMLKSDVKYRFVIDMASLPNNAA